MKNAFSFAVLIAWAALAVFLWWDGEREFAIGIALLFAVGLASGLGEIAMQAWARFRSH